MRCIGILLALLFLPFLPIPSWGQGDIPSVTMEMGDRTVHVYYGVSRYYLLRKPEQPADETAYEATFGAIQLQYEGMRLSENRFLSLSDRTISFQFKSSDESVLYVTNTPRAAGFPYEPGTVIARKPGQATVTIEADGYKVKIPLTVIGLPIARLDDASAVYQKLGRPDRVADSLPVDRFFPSKCWFFDKYPDLSLRMKEAKSVLEISSPYYVIERYDKPSGLYPEPYLARTRNLDDIYRNPNEVWGIRPKPSTFLIRGDSARKTNLFAMTTRWKVTWKAKPRQGRFGSFSLKVRRAVTNELVQVVANVQQSDGEVSYLYEAGAFYLDIDARDCEYEILMEEAPASIRLIQP